MTQPKRPFDLWLSENFEAIAISIAMALVLKFFVVEAYQIPTGSMQPTILGDEMAGIKDRIFADKLVTMLREPRRWEVMIFRFPLDERRLYVKRLVGLPGETLTVRGGDIWVDGEVAVKPDAINESVLKAVFPVKDGGIDVGRAFRHGGGAEPTFEDRSVTFPSGDSSSIVLREDVVDRYLHGYDDDWGIRSAAPAHHAVPDLDLAGELSLAEGARGCAVELLSDVSRVTWTLTTEGQGNGSVAIAPPEDGATPWHVQALDPGQQLHAGGSVELQLRRVDRQIVLWVDGEEWLRLDDEHSPTLPEATAVASLAVTVDGGGRLGDVVVRRDIHYLPRTPFHHGNQDTWEIPDDSYFAMGDNTQKSHDSRTWETRSYTLDDGRELEGFWFPAPTRGPAPSDANPRWHQNGSMTFADVHGDEFTFRPHQIRDEGQHPAPFIHRRYLLGKAVVVFWPIPPFGPFRWKLVQ